MASHIILPPEDDDEHQHHEDDEEEEAAAAREGAGRGQPDQSAKAKAALPFSASCVRISRDSYPNLRALRNASSISLADAAYAKISEGDFGYVLDDVPHLTDYLPDIPTYPNPLQDHPAYSTVKQYFVNEDDTVPQKVVVQKNSRRGVHFRRAGPRQRIYFESDEVKACIVTCGGLCPGLNTVIRELVCGLSHMYNVSKIYGIQNGYKGFYSSNYLQLTPNSVNDIHKRGGTVLGTSRGGHDTKKIVDNIQDRGINQVYIIGGDGTQKGAYEIFKEIRKRGLKVSVAGVPKTIDNDIAIIDKSFGFDTAVEEAQRAIDSAHVEACSAENGIGLVKLMGRYSGFIAMYATLASRDVDCCLIPESPFYMDGEGGLLEYIERRLKENKHMVIVVAEGAGQDLIAKSIATSDQQDASGNKLLLDIGLWLTHKIKDYFKSKKMEMTIKYIDPTYMIRAIPSNASDNVYCTLLAHSAIHGAMAGYSSTVGMVNGRHTYIPFYRVTSTRNKVRITDRMWARLLSSTNQPSFLSQKDIDEASEADRLANRPPLPTVVSHRAANSFEQSASSSANGKNIGVPALNFQYTCSAAVAFEGMRSRPRTMAARSSLLLLCLAAASVLQARAQPDTTGFISIDCGLPGTASYVDDTTKLTYVPDAAFIDAGTNQNISAAYIKPDLATQYLNLRSFPDGARSCYTLRPLEAGSKYLLRATFMYGNYDGLSRPPVFDLYVGVDFWITVNITDVGMPVFGETIVVVPGDFVQVCLVNTGAGTPFISGLDLRPFKSSLYPQANSTSGLVLLDRANVGGDAIVRYPDDPHDRFWVPWVVDATLGTTISTTETVSHLADSLFEAPSKVMQTAGTPLDITKNIEFSWVSQQQQPNKDPPSSYILILHFSELQRLPKNAVRQFYIYLNDELLYEGGLTPGYLYSGAMYSKIPFNDKVRYYNISINATANSTLPPIINAVELFSVFSTADVATDSQDVSAITAIKEKYHVQKNWMGDPCLPKTLAWNGLNCSYAISDPPRITSVNLSFSALDGDISYSFANLKAVQYLDLSYNNLTGSIPDSLSQLSSLTVLDLTGNQLNGSIPTGLLKRIQDGSLTIKYGNNPNLCTNADSCSATKGSSKLAIYIAVPVVLVVVIISVTVLLFCLLRQKKKGTTNNAVKPLNETSISHVSAGVAEHTPSSLQLENRQFTYKELKTITNNFRHVLGQGGFGYVYDGFLEDGTQVAVKLRSDSSNQGVKEFLAEAQILTRIHHKNLVSMIGYCKDGEYMALVYEYMSQGTLQEHIAGNGPNGRFLSWRQRLKIALESAQGLEYLHKGCNPPLIHRDVKATNILLNSKLEAKIADFGLSKAFNRDNDTHISTNAIVGTPGYVDPEYHTTMQPTTKSDVYSFGVVLLELIAARPAILRDPEPTSIIKWAQLRLARGNIESIVDPRMHGDYDVNGVWKVADIALKCTAMSSMKRPTMTDVVVQLQGCLELEEGRACSGHGNGGFYTGNSRGPYSGYNAYIANGHSTDVSQSSTTFEVEHNFVRVPTMPTGPAAR